MKMKYSKDDIIEALRCCSLNGRNSCETCPLKVECEANPLESILAKYALEVVDTLVTVNMALADQNKRLITDTKKLYNNINDSLTPVTGHPGLYTISEAGLNEFNRVLGGIHEKDS